TQCDLDRAAIHEGITQVNTVTYTFGHDHAFLERGARQQHTEASAFISTDQVHLPYDCIQNAASQTLQSILCLLRLRFHAVVVLLDLNQQHAKCGSSAFPFRNPLANVPEERRPIALEPPC